MTGNDDLLNRVPLFLRRGERSAPPSARPTNGAGMPPEPVREERREAAAPGPALPAPAAPTAPLRISMRNGRAVLPATKATPIESSQRPRPVTPAGDEGDSPFQVTLPRDLIRQVRMRAAEEGTTHRAIILRALRQCGFSVAEGEDVDRRRSPARGG